MADRRLHSERSSTLIVGDTVLGDAVTSRSADVHLRGGRSCCELEVLEVSVDLRKKNVIPN